jgi:hypothetical protein
VLWSLILVGKFSTTQVGSAIAEGVQAYKAGYFLVLRSRVLPVTAVRAIHTHSTEELTRPKDLAFINRDL